MELREVTICEKGINPEAQFRILKEDTGDNMSNTMSELQSVLERLSKKLEEKDDEDKEDKKAGKDMKMKDNESKDKGIEDLLDAPDKKDEDDDGNMKETLREAREDKKDKPAMDDDEDEEDMMYGDDMTAKADDMITTSDYLIWLEQTAKSAGFDPSAARDHFNKGYGPGETSFDMRGQGSLEGAGEDDSGKRPQPTLVLRLLETKM